MRKRIFIASLAALAAIGLAFAQTLNVRNFVAVNDVSLGGDQHEDVVFFQTESVRYDIYIRRGPARVSIPSTSEPVWRAWNATNVSELFIDVTGTVQNAGSGHIRVELTPAQSNLATGEYESVVQLWDTTNYMGTVARSKLDVEWSPNSANYTIVSPGPVYRLSTEDHTHASTGTQAGTVAHSVLTGLTSGDPHTQYRLESEDHSHASTGAQAGTIDHGVITGVTDDDHTIYRLESADHTHASTGAEAGTIDHGAATTGLTDDDHTIYRLESADHTHASTGMQAGKIDHGTAIDGLTDDDHTQYRLESADHTHASTGAEAGTIDHGALTGTGDDDHSLYLQNTEISTSSELAGLLDDETGSGLAVFGTSPTLSAPYIERQHVALTGSSSPVELTVAQSNFGFITADTARTIELTGSPARGMTLTILVTADVVITIDGNGKDLWMDGTTDTDPAEIVNSGSAGECISLFYDEDTTEWRAFHVEGSWTI